MGQWITVITALIGLVAAAFTGTGEVSDEQAAALNEVTPGFGDAMQSTTSAVNGVAPEFTKWSATQATANALGFSVFSGGGTFLSNISSFLGSVNPLLLLGGGFLAWKVLTD